MCKHGDDDRVMNVCFDAKLSHIACKTIAYFCVNVYLSYFIFIFVGYCLQAKNRAARNRPRNRGLRGMFRTAQFPPANMQTGLNSWIQFQKWRVC
jgi:hypothetical protein